MTDQSHLDNKYFITHDTYNCPFCNRGSVQFSYLDDYTFDWSNEKTCFVYFIRCDGCNSTSMHLSFEDIEGKRSDGYGGLNRFDNTIDLDSKIFYSRPTSFFTLDSKIPEILRELITESEGCLKMNYLTGASACTRKAIYELTIIENCDGDDYESKIKYLKKKYSNADPDLFDVLCHLKDMTSDKIHEQSWDMWNSTHLTLFIETLKSILHEIYVIPAKRKEGSSKIKELLRLAKGKKKTVKDKIVEKS